MSTIIAEFCRTARLLNDLDILEFDVFGQFPLERFIYILSYVLGRRAVLLKIKYPFQGQIIKLGYDIINHSLEPLEIHYKAQSIEFVTAEFGGNEPIVFVFGLF